MVFSFGAIGAGKSIASRAERKVTKLAEGVYEIEHRDASDGLASGNTTVIVGDRQVVVDPGLLAGDAREDIAQIRTWTTAAALAYES